MFVKVGQILTADDHEPGLDDLGQDLESEEHKPDKGQELDWSYG